MFPFARRADPVQTPLSPDDPTKTISVFLSYAHEDEALKATFLNEFADQGIRAVTKFWDDRHLHFSTEWEEQLEYHMRASCVILLLVTDNFLSSSYCIGHEVPLAIDLMTAGRANVLAVVLRPLTKSTDPLAGIPRWPSHDALSESPEVARRLEYLRLQIRIWIVDRLLRGDGDDYWYALARHGIQFPSRRRVITWSVICSAAGVVLAFIFSVQVQGIASLAAIFAACVIWKWWHRTHVSPIGAYVDDDSH